MELREFFKQHPKVALAFSGGVDSSYLLWACAKWAEDFRAYYVKSPFQPEFEYRDAIKVAEQVGHPMTVIELDVLGDPAVTANPANRCYHCKRQIMGNILKRAALDGYSVLIDGTNASDDAGDRPGMKALTEMQVLSPLRICGITKAEVRARSREAGLITWDKPAYACLATRVPTGQVLTQEILTAVEESENILFAMGFTDFRVRVRGEAALLQVTEEQMTRAGELWDTIHGKLELYFDEVRLDPTARPRSN